MIRPPPIRFDGFVKSPIWFAVQPLVSLFPKRFERRSQKPFYDFTNIGV